MSAPVLPAGPAALGAALEALAAGEVVGIPTDTVYGLAADPWRPGATDRLFAVKDRPREVVIPVLVADLGQAQRLAEIDPDGPARRLMDRWWPGALTVVVPALPGHGADIGGDGRSVGLRCPDHPVAVALCAAAGPLATTSANRHGEAPLTEAAAVAANLPGVALVIDGGRCDAPPSTVVDATGAEVRLLREGALTWSELAGS
jgi:L-threonylcarbamoyladenylate synthase